MKDYKSKILKIFIPIMLSNVISQIQMLIDRIFLGRMDVLFMSAVGNATAPVWTTLSFVFSLSMGASILISQKVGSKEVEAGKEFAASLVKYHNVIPVLLFLFCEDFIMMVVIVFTVVTAFCGKIRFKFPFCKKFSGIVGISSYAWHFF